MSNDQNQNNTQNIRKISVNAQYIKDLSFENPHAPNSLIAKGEKPNIKIGVDVKVNPLQEKVFEVNLVINASARSKDDDKAIFLIEVNYAGVFTVDVPQAEFEPVLMVYCPGILFPYARRIVSDTTRDGGFPPLMLDPVDFSALYHQHKINQQAEAKNQKSENTSETIN